jgi:hypothetical protein
VLGLTKHAAHLACLPPKEGRHIGKDQKGQIHGTRPMGAFLLAAEALRLASTTFERIAELVLRCLLPFAGGGTPRHTHGEEQG